MKREAGILLPVSSLPGTLGIGDFGECAYEWVDLLDQSGVGLWQILPLNPLGYGNSPYQAYSSFAGDEIYISIEKLFSDLKIPYQQEVWASNFIAYEDVRARKLGHLKEAYRFFNKQKAYQTFLKQAFWLDDYVEFIALKRLNHYQSWLDWEITSCTEAEKDFERFIQYIFFSQWQALKNYANDKGIQIVGDLPIYVGHDSSDVYHNREFFYLDEKNHPSQVAGVPPDNFSDEGQLWGNPLYKWDVLKEHGYSYWVEKLKWNQVLFDVIRIDHFRAFDTYWAIPGGSKTAKTGEWRLGPAHDFFNAMFAAIDDLNIVVEDLGDLRPEVLQLRDDFSFKGMKIIQFLLKDHELIDNMYMSENFIAYTGTHDNKTMAGHLKEDIAPARQAALMRQLPHYGDSLVERICFYTLSLNASWAILPLQDLLELDNQARLNTPATVGSPNWEWKLNDFKATYQALERFKTMVKVTKRQK